MNAVHPTRPTRAGSTLTDESAVCPTGGGFEKTAWSVRIHDGWVSVSYLAWRRKIDAVVAEVEAEDDPHRAVSSRNWFDRPPQVWYRRSVRVVAPIGTRFRRRVWTPVRDGAMGIHYQRFDEEMELRAEGRLISVRVLAERKRHRKEAELPPLPFDETVQQLGQLVAHLAARDFGCESQVSRRPT